jgi:hypothetical protein
MIICTRKFRPKLSHKIVTWRGLAARRHVLVHPSKLVEEVAARPVDRQVVLEVAVPGQGNNVLIFFRAFLGCPLILKTH